MIAIIDYDIGNLGAVANMLQRIGARCEITRDPTKIEAAERIILPGNGAFDACATGLRATGLVPLLEEKVLRQGVPLLGICVGAQLLGHSSEEGREPGLGWVPARVRRFSQAPKLPVPHMGWNEVRARDANHPLVVGLDAAPRFYFVHSYFIEPESDSDILLSATYGIEFAAGIARGNIAGVQFHPEKSHRFGRRLLSNFAGKA